MEFPSVIFSGVMDHALGWTLLHSIWQFTLIALLTGILLYAGRKKTAQWRYWLANSGIALMLLVATGTYLWLYFNSSYEKQSIAKAFKEASTFAPSKRAAGLTTPVITPKVKTLSTGQQYLEQQLEVQHPSPYKAYFDEHAPLLLLVWMGGLMIALFRFLTGVSFAMTIRRRFNFEVDPYWVELFEKLCARAGVTKPIQLLESAMAKGPMTMGFIKPVIFFPIGMINKLSEKEVEAILAHELAHILRHDYLFNILQSLIESLFYYHPAVWWLSNQVRIEREHACDDHAIALTGNKLNYAKALVNVQELSQQSAYLVPGFAGHQKNQLLQRLQRLFAPPSFKINAMEKWLTTIIVLFTVIALAFGQQVKQWSDSQDPAKTEQAPFSGVWEAYFRSDSVSMMLTHRHPDGRGQWVISDDYLQTQFSGLDVKAVAMNFQMIRPAGTMRFTGTREGQTAYGRYTFEPSTSFINALKKFGIEHFENELLLNCFQANMREDFLSFLKKEFPEVSAEELMELAVFKIDEQTVQSYKSLGKMVDLQKLDVGKLVELHIANVSPERVKGYVDTGLKGLDLEQITKMAIHNIDPAYIAELTKAGIQGLNADKVIEANIHGIDPDEVAQMSASAGGGVLALEELVARKIHQVTPEFVAKMRAAGLDNVEDSDWLALRVHDITPEYVRELQQAGLGQLSVEDILMFKVQGITAARVAEYKATGFAKLSTDDVVNLNIHGVTGAYIAFCNGLDPGRIRVDDVINMKIHGINKERATAFQQLFSKVSVDELISATVIGVSPEYVKGQMNRGIRKNNLQAYIDLKVVEEQ